MYFFKWFIVRTFKMFPRNWSISLPCPQITTVLAAALPSFYRSVPWYHFFLYPFPPPEDFCHHPFPHVAPFVLHHCRLVAPPPPDHFPTLPANCAAWWPNLWSTSCICCFCVKHTNVLPYDITRLVLPTCLSCTSIQATSQKSELNDCPAEFYLLFLFQDDPCHKALRKHGYSCCCP